MSSCVVLFGFVICYYQFSLPSSHLSRTSVSYAQKLYAEELGVQALHQITMNTSTVSQTTQVAREAIERVCQELRSKYAELERRRKSAADTNQE